MQSYVVPCPSGFRDAVIALAERRQATVSDLVHGFLAIAGTALVEAAPDPGDAPPGDREHITLKSGPRQGQVLRRKPRLQLRLRSGLTPVLIRKALGMLLALDQGQLVLDIRRPGQAGSPADADRGRLVDDLAAARTVTEEAWSVARRAQTVADAARERAAEMETLVRLLAFDPLPQGVRSAADARYVLGFPPAAVLTRETVKARFRMLSQIFHPDKPTGDTARMGQLIDAMRFLETRLARGTAKTA